MSSPDHSLIDAVDRARAAVEQEMPIEAGFDNSTWSKEIVQQA
jgi:hypothetical protein